MDETKRQRQKEQTRLLLLNTAYRLFSEQGFAGTRMGDIARAAGVSHGTVFAHFPTQEQLTAEVIRKHGRQMTMRTHELSESSAGLRPLLEAHLEGIREQEGFYTNLILESHLLPQAARDCLVTLHSALSHHFCRALDADPHIDGASPPPAHILFNLWLGLLHRFLTNRDLFVPTGSVIERRGQEMLDGYLYLIQKKGDGI